MKKSDERFPKLKYFFSAYFHQGWSEAVVSDFKDNNPRDTVEQATRELRDLLSLELSESELQAVIVHELGANLRPQFTYREWARDVLDCLGS